MKVISSTNPNGALLKGLDHLLLSGTLEDSRNGPVLVSQSPVTTVTAKPRQRVLFSALRDANPFFQVMEAVWMLCGRNDVALPAVYAKQLQLYSDDGARLNGAYGHRWRNHFGFDQLEELISELSTNPKTRRCVLSMWDGHEDLQAAAAGSLDVPCNTHIYFRVNPSGALDMTVCCRSNDAVWGAHGANVVHFSFLLEYIADCLGCQVGIMYQVSNNYHIYTERDDVKRLVTMTAPGDVNDLAHGISNYAVDDRYLSLRTTTYPVITAGTSLERRQEWHKNAELILEAALVGHVRGLRRSMELMPASDPFLREIVLPLAAAHEAYKEGDHSSAWSLASEIAAPDWRTACIEWMQRRKTWKGPTHAPF